MDLERDPVNALGHIYAASAMGAGLEPELMTDEGEAPEYSVRSPDGRWECVLDEDRRISTIFLHGDLGSSFPFSLRPGMSPAEVEAVVGDAPTQAGEAQEVAVLGRFGEYKRWDRPGYSLHAEFDLDGGLKMLTFMSPDAAP